MKIFDVRFFCLIFILQTTLYASPAKDAWNGETYANNSQSQKSSADEFLHAIHFNGTEYILDVGCGDGKITASLAREVPQGVVVGVDISPSMIQKAQETFVNQKNLSFFVEDAARVNFNQQFDLITSFTVMQWVLEQKEALRCFERV